MTNARSLRRALAPHRGFHRNRLVTAGLFAAVTAGAVAPLALGSAVAAPVASATPSSGFASSMFDRGVAAQPVLATSPTLVANLVKQYQSAYGSVGLNQMPIFTVPANQPLVPVTVRTGCHNFATATTPSATAAFATGTAVPIPVGAYTTDPLYKNDSAIIISQPSTNSEWELWQAANNGNGTWSACAGGKLAPSTSSGIFPTAYGVSASGLSYGALTITEADVASGAIHHTLALDVTHCNYHTLPAVRGDCGSDLGQPSEGTWFRMSSTAVMPTNLTPLAQMVFHALQTYGAVVTDQAGAVMFQAENRKDWAVSGGTGTDPITVASLNKPQYSVLNGMPWSSLQVIQPPSS